MASKKGLGKGLSALITENIKDVKEETNSLKEGVVVLNINNIEPNKEQPRKHFNEDALSELSDSIKQYGVIQPIIVQKKNDYYAIIAGERRWRASKLAGLKEVPVIIKDFSSQKILEISLIENIQREDLNPIEEAKAFQRLIKEFNLKQDDVAEKVSKSRSAIANSLRLLNLDHRVQEMVIDEMISSGHSRALLSLEDKDAQYRIANKIFDEKLSVRETEKLIKELLTPKKEKNTKTKTNPIYTDIEERLKEILGTKVKINNKNNKKGKIEIEYYSQEELENIIDILESNG
ncbi:ParB family chromosome partitioning protein [Natranaerovirga pectinivora]|uniref:ParB family chromosome partitioning protein n=1 Tax=Natranaerovirga pectinivora TaxID=682400 RepID=A0A4R3MF01_9FIRM|nr:ParB/RepB/Spo0J family partition protein [Natranaerovirga pectinivora]TCT12257.1 ParB family chromosome partitioning protein [Natranaerovirga pectinivora]